MPGRSCWRWALSDLDDYFDFLGDPSVGTDIWDNVDGASGCAMSCSPVAPDLKGESRTEGPREGEAGKSAL